MTLPIDKERRKSILTQGDLEEIARLLKDNSLCNNHKCAFEDFDQEDIDAVKDVATIFKRVKTKVFDSIYYFIIALLVGLVILISTHELWNTGGK